MVVEGGLGDAEAFGYLAQRGPLVPLFREQFQRHLLDARARVAPSAAGRGVAVRGPELFWALVG